MDAYARIIIAICALTVARTFSHDTMPAISNSSLPNNTAPPPRPEGTPAPTECYIRTERLYLCRNQSANIEVNTTEDYDCTHCRNEFEEYARACFNTSSADAEISALNESCLSDDVGSVSLSVECIEARDELVKCTQPLPTSGRERLCITCYSQWVMYNFKCGRNPLRTHIVVLNLCRSPLPGSSPTTPVTSPATPVIPPDQVTDKCRRMMDETSICLDESYITEQEARCDNCRSSVSRYINECIDMPELRQMYINLVDNQLKRICQLEKSEESSSMSPVGQYALLTTLLFFLSLLSH